ncbi:aldehyde dehydrogenase family protein [Streptomyces sp. 3214.6]|uniref:aldehyde dehydrogenase family protein n=1 Tax=Streptomyces sp. 3214.6 TaxID=1882757 RepID=UPI00090AF09C|nr:aldehyde dehydrogenase family protein [Streptomyces sp. 3214.6]SHI26143.1 phenylacetic acid degradation protein paaN [Streptomyces sp. 3214.6]
MRDQDPDPTALFDKHRHLLDRARAATADRTNWSAYDDAPPSGPADADRADAWLREQCGRPFPLDHPGTPRRQDDEVSPYTGEPLGISYPHATPDELIEAAEKAWEGWRTADAPVRVGVCLEICEQLFAANDRLAAAAMHTTGQSRGMSLAGSGTNALDRGLEAIAMAYEALRRTPSGAPWSRAFGRTTVTLDKRYRVQPLGVAVVIACASFPAWNVYPALFANLATGNPVVVKPHPTSVLQMALAVGICREVIAAAGFDTDLVTLAVDSVAEPVAQRLVRHEKTRIVDFTGSAGFGEWIEANARRTQVYTETSGTNSVLLESVTDPEPVLRALAGSLCLFSAQMCTSPQNIFVPREGLRTATGVLTVDELAAALADAIRAVSTVPRRAAAVMGAVQSARTLDELALLTEEVRRRGSVVLEPAGYPHPEHPGARTSGPLLARIDVADHDLYGFERFGPVAFLITCDDAGQALARATEDAREGGAITAFVYSTDEAYLERAEEGYARAGAALTVNLTGPMPLNFSAAFSDYHVTGLNPAGTATLTDESFIAGRFRVVQSRRPAPNAGHHRSGASS